MRPKTFVNALMQGRVGSLRIADSRIAALDAPATADDDVVDLNGERLLPGFINAHDHLQLNSLPALDNVGPYAHVTQWIADINTRRRLDRVFEAQVAVARNARLLIGGIKNLLSGVTTVAHHDPFYPYLSNAHFPVDVVARYGWAHSLYIDGEHKVVHSHEDTPKDWPWIIHAAEGVNPEAAAEFERLDELGCLKPNTVIVHGVALDSAQRARLASVGAALVWCPSSNVRLFGTTAEVQDLLTQGHVVLGTDSRLSGSRDLLDELRCAGQYPFVDERMLQSMITENSARILRLKDRGCLRVGARADLVVLPAKASLSNVRRADVRLVVVGGELRYGDPDLMRCSVGAAEACVDGRKKFLDRRIVAQLRRWQVAEKGLVISHRGMRAA